MTRWTKSWPMSPPISRRCSTTAPVGIDELVRQSGGNAGAVQMALLELEIAGRLVRHAGGRVSLGA